MAKGRKTGGRQPGSLNKATVTAREAIANLVEYATPLMAGWLDQIAQEHGPQAAWRCMTDLLEYHVPKLARTELTGKDGSDLLPKVLTYKVEP